MSKSRGPTKAEQILREAKQRVDRAKAEVEAVYHELQAKKAVRDAFQDSYEALEKTLATPKRQRTPKSAKDPAPEQQTLTAAAGTNGAKAQSGKKPATQPADGAIVGAQ